MTAVLNRGWVRVACGWLIVLMTALALLAFSAWDVVDDAYISFRYSFNLAHGNGLVFNPGEWIEGFTNLLWTVLMAGPIAVGIPVDSVAVYVGIACGAFAVVDTFRTARALGVNQWIALAASALLAAYPGYWLVMGNGLESGLFTFLLMRTIFTLVAGSSPWTPGLWAGLLFATRPESLFVMPLAVAYRLLAGGFSPREWLRRITTTDMTLLVGPWLAIVLAISLWRLHTYGALLPNSIVAKSVPAYTLAFLLPNVREGFRYIERFVGTAAPLALGVLLAPLFAARLRAVWFFLAIIAAQCFILLVNGGDWVPNYRLLVHYTPVMSVLLAIGLSGLIRRAAALGLTPRSLALGGAAVLVAGSGGFLLEHNTWRSTPDLESTPHITFDCYGAIANAIKPALVPGDKVAPEALGEFSYILSDTYSHDMLGLTDSYLARYGTFYIPMFGKEDLTYTYTHIHPEVFISHTQDAKGSLAQFARAVGPEFDSEYSTFRFPSLEGCDRISMSVSRESADRIVPALQPLNPRLISVAAQLATYN
ncbi:MAG: hypothetical protein JOZ65_31625 [Chloroflexi bacterium]|nr:hypothetical protein [Chloroflexota bacterium]